VLELGGRRRRRLFALRRRGAAAGWGARVTTVSVFAWLIGPAGEAQRLVLEVSAGLPPALVVRCQALVNGRLARFSSEYRIERADPAAPVYRWHAAAWRDADLPASALRLEDPVLFDPPEAGVQ
jgi:hypothetical protein